MLRGPLRGLSDTGLPFTTPVVHRSDKAAHARRRCYRDFGRKDAALSPYRGAALADPILCSGLAVFRAQESCRIRSRSRVHALGSGFARLPE